MGKQKIFQNKEKLIKYNQCYVYLDVFSNGDCVTKSKSGQVFSTS